MGCIYFDTFFIPVSNTLLHHLINTFLPRGTLYAIFKCISFLHFLIVNFLILALLFFSYKYLNSLCFLLYVFVVVVIVEYVICEALVWFLSGIYYK